MDKLKGIEGVYNPDKSTLKEKMVLALSGGVDSLVMAYLLKIQKYDLIAVTVLPDWEGFSEPLQNFSCGISAEKLTHLQEFCHRLNIPLHLIKASEELKENVVNKWITNRLSGKLSRHCWDCHDMRISLVYEKMLELKCNKFATGHFAKIFHHEGHGTVFVHTSNDEINDQSALLSRLPNEILKSLHLPLSDLTRKEVLKLADNFGVDFDDKKITMHSCLPWRGENIDFFQKNVPQKFKRGGEIQNSAGNQIYGKHEGVFNFTYGESFEFREDGKPQVGYFAEYNNAEKIVVIRDENFFLRDKILLTNCLFGDETPWISPLKGYAIITSGMAEECWIIPKTLGAVYLEFAAPVKILEGSVISVVKKKGKNAKVYLTGLAQFLPLDPPAEEGKSVTPPVNFSQDF